MLKLPEHDPNHPIRSGIEYGAAKAVNKWLPKYKRAGVKIALLFGIQAAVVGVFIADHQLFDDQLKKAVTPVVLALKNKISS